MNVLVMITIHWKSNIIVQAYETQWDVSVCYTWGSSLLRASNLYSVSLVYCFCSCSFPSRFYNLLLIVVFLNALQIWMCTFQVMYIILNAPRVPLNEEEKKKKSESHIHQSEITYSIIQVAFSLFTEKKSEFFCGTTCTIHVEKKKN